MILGARCGRKEGERKKELKSGGVYTDVNKANHGTNAKNEQIIDNHCLFSDFNQTATAG